MLSDEWFVRYTLLEKLAQKLYRKFHECDGCTNEHMKGRMERLKLYTPQHKGREYNQQKRENGRRNFFMTKSPRKNVADVLSHYVSRTYFLENLTQPVQKVPNRKKEPIGGTFREYT